jgi:hypothetical protein
MHINSCVHHYACHSFHLDPSSSILSTFCEISDSHSSGYEHDSLLDIARRSRKSRPMFQRCVHPDDGSITHLGNVYLYETTRHNIPKLSSSKMFGVFIVSNFKLDTNLKHIEYLSTCQRFRHYFSVAQNILSRTIQR